MGTNGGDKDNNSTPLDQSTLTHPESGLDSVSGVRAGGGLRGMEANTDESKGAPCEPQRGSGSTHEVGVNSHGENLPEST